MTTVWSSSDSDHPRSRGVYGCGAAASDAPGGSSPLARGLPICDGVSSAETGIIPARAGFTSSGACEGLTMRGSSPLARGLLRLPLSFGCSERIIPARAGFTRPAPPRRRSPSGSSPLARGLQKRLGVAAAHARIIPARAGFTGSSGPGGSRCGDHPRSRGVYTHERRTGDDPTWIIPARAGFTRGRSPTRPCWGDHPRSRGVYYFSPGEADSRAGSSPLARGLRHRLRLAGWGAGIIPARAGFTGQDAQMRRHLADHPRSRGVYLQWRRRPVAPQGIIPARAGFTPTHPGRGPHRTRIIPARAGFTRFRMCGRCPRWDHPRSRGVYVLVGLSESADEGSSPLARGLLSSTNCRGSMPRIIPARAGFTAPGPRPSGRDRDHPRSRGVYAHFCPKIGHGSWIIPARAGFTGRSRPRQPR